MTEVSQLRLNVMRGFFLLLFLERAYRIVAKLLSDDPVPGAFDGVAYAFWGALALLALLGLRHPLKMLPVLLMFLVYKLLWLLMVALPMWSAGTPFDAQMTQFTWAMAVGAAIDVLVIPWGYVVANYVRAPADGSTGASRA